MRPPPTPPHSSSARTSTRSRRPTRAASSARASGRARSRSSRLRLPRRPRLHLQRRPAAATRDRERLCARRPEGEQVLPHHTPSALLFILSFSLLHVHTLFNRLLYSILITLSFQSEQGYNMSIGLSLNARRAKQRLVSGAEFNNVESPVLLRESEPWVVFERGGREMAPRMASRADMYSVLARLEAVLLVLSVRSPLTSNWKLTCTI